MTLKTRTGNNYHDTTRKLIGFSEDTLNRFDDAVDSLQSQSKKYSQKVEKYMAHHPLHGIGLSFLAGIGFVLMLRGLFKR